MWLVFLRKAAVLLCLALGATAPAMAAPGDVAWSLDLPGGVKTYGSPAVSANGTLYIGTYDGATRGNLTAVSPDGTREWTTRLCSGTMLSAPALSPNGTIYIRTYGAGAPTEDNLTAVSPNGTKAWTVKLGKSKLRSSPAVSSNGTIYIGTYGLSGTQGNLTAIAPDGTREWTVRVGSSVMDSSPALSPNGTIYIGVFGAVGSQDGNLTAVSADGTREWSIRVGSDMRSSPAVSANGTIYIGAYGSTLIQGNLTAVSPDGSREWTVTLYVAPQYLYSSPAVSSNGTIYIGTFDASNGNLTAVSPDGRKEWTVKVGSSNMYSSPAVSANGTIYIGASGSGDGNLTAVSPDGKRQWTVELGSSDMSASPTLSANGTVYAVNEDGNLVSIEGDGSGLHGAWPKFHQGGWSTGRYEFGVEVAPDQESGVAIALVRTNSSAITPRTLSGTYHIGDSPASEEKAFRAKITPNGAVGKFRFKLLGTDAAASNSNLYKLFADGSTLRFDGYASSGCGASDGAWWITDANGRYMEPNARLKPGSIYYVEFYVQDNGSYDLDATAGVIVDPCVLTQGSSSSSSSGCVLNPDAEFSLEWLLLALAPLLWIVRRRGRLGCGGREADHPPESKSFGFMSNRQRM
jgi:outer membrane protein assembly factor BamB